MTLKILKINFLVESSGRKFTAFRLYKTPVCEWGLREDGKLFMIEEIIDENKGIVVHVKEL